MNISELSIRRHVFAWMLMSGLIVFGAISLLRMGISQNPDVDLPYLSISATMRGAAPSVMETEIVDQIENAVMAVQGVRALSSTARNSSAQVSIEFDLGRDIDVALQEVQSKLAQAQRNLPPEMDPIVITKTNPDDEPILWVAISTKTTPLREIMLYVRDSLKDQFTTISDVGDVFLGGYVEPNLRVWVSGAKLRAHALTVGDVINAISSEHQERPAGWIDSGDREFNVRTMGEALSPAEFSRISINTRGGSPNYRPIQISDVARVEDGLADVRRLSRTRGRTAVGLGILKQRGANAVEVARNVRKRIDELRKTVPADVEISIVNDATRFIEESVGELKFTLVLSALLTGLVCWLFLGSWGSTLNVVLAIPTSVLGTFIVLYFSGFTLNTITLLALSLSIGIVVDDAIMVLENIVRHQERGEARVAAAISGSREITFAAIATSASIVAIFLPVAFMEGVIGKFFFQFGVTISAAVLLSLVEALTLTPMRCSQFVDAGRRRGRIGRVADTVFARVARGYRHTLGWSLHHRAAVLGASLLVFISLGFAVVPLRKEFLPAQDSSLFMVRLRTPVGSSLSFTDGKVRQAERIILERPELANLYASVGGFGGNDPTQGFLFISLKPKGHRGRDPVLHHELSQGELMVLIRKLLARIDDARIFVIDPSTRGFGGGRGFPVEFTVQGPDWDRLGELSEKIKGELARTGLMVDIDTDYRIGMPELRIHPDRARAQARGVSIAAIAQTVEACVGGTNIAQYSSGGHRYDVRLQLEAEDRLSEASIRTIAVRNNRGELIPLGDVVRMEKVPTLQLISRYNRERAIKVTANIKPGVSLQDALRAATAVSAKLLPAGYHSTMGGSSQSFKESFLSLGWALVLGILVAYMVLASQFNSFIDPVTVLMALPFSFSGAFLALLVTGRSFNIYSFIGLVLLMGLVKKNSILLVDFTNKVRERAGRRHTVREGLLEACPIRLRPILMTSTATIAGAIPAAVAFGPGAEARSPMAIAVIGGVFVSTLLTLYVVPCVYSLFARLDDRWAPEPAVHAARRPSR
ncbi:MAG: efflux RND transporter permease subunit [Candidatus Coatesbacteria bacterium]